MTSFLSTPTLGGKLVIANCVSWVVLIIFSHNEILPYLPYLPYSVSIVLAVLLSLPFAIISLLPSLGAPSVADIILDAVVIGLNSIAW